MKERRYDRDYVRRWVNWEEYLREERPDLPQTFDGFEQALEELYASYTPEFAAKESGVEAAKIVEIARAVGGAFGALATHVWRNTAAGNLGGWQVARALELLVVLTGSVGTPGGTAPNAYNKAIPAPPMMPPPGKVWSELLMPKEYPLAFFEMSFLLPHFLKEGRGKLAMYFTRVYNPVWTNPDGMSWIEMLTDEAKVERHACLTPIWSETAWFADYVLPMGHASERHDLMSQETHAARWIGFRQPVLRVALERQGKVFDSTWQAHEAAGIGQVWEEDEFWIELSWRIDPDGSLGIRKYFESPYRPGEKLRIAEFYQWIFEHSVPGLPEAAAKEGLTPLDYMRKYGAFLVEDNVYASHEKPLGAKDLDGATVEPGSKVVSRGGARGRRRDRRRRADGVSDAVAQARVLLADAQGVEVAGAGGAAVRAEPRALLEDRRRARRDGAAADVPAAHADPHALGELEVAQRDLAHEPAVGASRRRAPARGRDGRSAEGGHRHRLLRRQGLGHRGDAAGHPRLLASHRAVASVREHRRRALVHRARRPQAGAARRSGACDSSTACVRSRARIRIPSASGGKRPGCNQNLTFPVQPDPVSGQHCWHQKVTVTKPGPDDRYGDIFVDTAKSFEVYRQWLALARPAPGPGGLRRPLWLPRAFKPDASVYRLPD